MKVTLAMKPAAKSFIPIEAEAIVPKNFLSGTDLSVWRGNRSLDLTRSSRSRWRAMPTGRKTSRLSYLGLIRSA